MLNHERKPPIGIEPRWSWLERRRQDILAAIKRYEQAGMKPPIAWLKELRDLLGFIGDVR